MIIMTMEEIPIKAGSRKSENLAQLSQKKWHILFVHLKLIMSLTWVIGSQCQFAGKSNLAIQVTKWYNFSHSTTHRPHGFQS